VRTPRIGLRTAVPVFLVAGLAAAGLFLLLRRDGVRAVHPPAAADRLPAGTRSFVVFSLEAEGRAHTTTWVAKAWEYVPSRPEAGLVLRCELDEAHGPALPVSDAPELLVLPTYRLVRADPARSRNPLTAAVRRPYRDVGSILYAVDYRTWEVRVIEKFEMFVDASVDGDVIRIATRQEPRRLVRSWPTPSARPEPLPDPTADLAYIPGESVEYRRADAETDAAPATRKNPRGQALDAAHALLGWKGRTAAVPGTGGRSAVAFSQDGRRLFLGAGDAASGNRFFDVDLSAGELREVPCPAEGLRRAEEMVIIPLRCP
jgi:hypothetical protein